MPPPTPWWSGCGPVAPAPRRPRVCHSPGRDDGHVMDVLELPDGAAWDAWLVAHPDAPEAWLRIGKRNAGAPYLPIEDALDVALCHGWIDGHRKGLDDVSFLQRYSP